MSYFVLLLTAGIMQIPSLPFCIAEEPKQENESLLSFIESNPGQQEILERITGLLKSNIEISEARHLDRKKLFSVIDRPSPRNWHHLLYMEIDIYQKQEALYNWQLKTTQDPKDRDQFTRMLAEAYDKQWDVANLIVQTGSERKRIGTIPQYEYIDGEILLDKIALKRLEHLSSGDATFDRLTQIHQLLENNVEKAKKLIVEMPERQYYIAPPLWKTFNECYTEFYLQQKQVELWRWEYETMEDGETRDKTAQKLAAAHERLLETAKRQVELCKELCAENVPAYDVYISCESQWDQLVFEMTAFNQNAIGNPQDANSQILEALESNVKKGETVVKNRDPEKNSHESPQAFFYNYFSRYARHYFQQKQVELLLWKYENASCQTERKAAEESLMDVYMQQWQTTTKIAEASREMHDVGLCSLKQYMDSENMHDKVTLDILNFMLKISDDRTVQQLKKPF